MLCKLFLYSMTERIFCFMYFIVRIAIPFSLEKLTCGWNFSLFSFTTFSLSLRVFKLCLWNIYQHNAFMIELCAMVFFWLNEFIYYSYRDKNKILSHPLWNCRMNRIDKYCFFYLLLFFKIEIQLLLFESKKSKLTRYFNSIGCLT